MLLAGRLKAQCLLPRYPEVRNGNPGVVIAKHWGGREGGQTPATCWRCRTRGSNTLKLGMGEGLQESSLTKDEARRSQASGGRDEVVPRNQLLGCQLLSL